MFSRQLPAQQLARLTDPATMMGKAAVQAYYDAFTRGHASGHAPCSFLSPMLVIAAHSGRDGGAGACGPLSPRGIRRGRGFRPLAADGAAGNYRQRPGFVPQPASRRATGNYRDLIARLSRTSRSVPSG